MTNVPPEEEGDQVAKPRTPESKQLMDQIPGITKFEKFQFMRGMAYSEDQICKYLHLTKNAFKHIDDRATKQVESYLRYQMKAGYIQNITNALQIQWKNVYALEKRALAIAKQCEKHNTDRKLAYAESHLRQTLNVAVEIVSKMQEETPAVAGFNQFIKENIIEGGGGAKKKLQAGRLPVTPDELKN